MGFLDHSTNNIIIDAVLTDYGRSLLAQGSGDFVISSFSLSDDEVDYGMITKFGRTVGKEKITKNTPIFEAQTKGSAAMKHRMITLPNPSITRIPTITFVDNGDETTGIIALERDAAGTGFLTKLVSLQQRVGNNSVLNPDGLTDSLFTVYVNSRFLGIAGKEPMSEEPMTRVSAYTINGPAGQTGTAFSFTLVAKTITTETYTQFGVSNASGGTTITTPVTVVGNQTGLRKDFKVTLSSQ